MSWSTYGFFCGGDPRTFTPDPEMSTEEERAKHKADCEKWDKGEQEGPEEAAGKMLRTEDGKIIGHIQRAGYGLGEQTFGEDEDAEGNGE